MRQTAADRNYKILNYLFESGRWENINNIGLKLGPSQNYDRLKDVMDSLAKRDIIQRWDELSESQKQDARNNDDVSQIKRKNNYRITETGRRKLIKIRDDCLDYETRTILNIDE